MQTGFFKPIQESPDRWQISSQFILTELTNHESDIELRIITVELWQQFLPNKNLGTMLCSYSLTQRQAEGWPTQAPIQQQEIMQEMIS